MAIDFPNTPTNGAVFTDPNGSKWFYEASTNSWVAVTSGGNYIPLDISSRPELP